MLTRIEIKDFALLREAVFEPGEGLVVLSGETGAGKSLLLDAIGSLTGKRMSKDRIASGANKATVEAIFSNVTNLPTDLCAQLSNYSPDDDLIISRELRADGRSVARINGQIVNLTLLKSVSDHLLGIHGQHEQQQIFEVSSHRQILDNFIGEKIKPLLDQWQQLILERKKLVRLIKKIGVSPRERKERLDFISYQLQELESANLKVEEENILYKQLKKLSAVEQLVSNLEQSLNYLQGDGEQIGAQKQLQIAAEVVEEISDFSENLLRVKERLYDLASATSEATSVLEEYLEKLDTDPRQVDKINKRLELYAKLQQKYHMDIERLLEHVDELKKEREELQNGQQNFAQYRKQLLELEAQLDEVSEQLHNLRTEAGTNLADLIIEALAQLDMRSQFATHITSQSTEKSKGYQEFGRDNIEFLLSTNVGEPLRPLAKIASGGEASRILLAIKSIIAQAEGLSVLIFDEIDTGISGKAATKVAKMMHALAQNRQVLCVSHMAQIAAIADEQWQISKRVTTDQTATELSRLDDAGRIDEIARLLAGDSEDKQARQLATKMLQQKREEVI